MTPRHALQRLADGCSGGRKLLQPPLVQELLRETPQYKAAREAGQTEAQALKTLGADGVDEVAARGKARLSAGFMALDPRNGQVRGLGGQPRLHQGPV